MKAWLMDVMSFGKQSLILVCDDGETYFCCDIYEVMSLQKRKNLEILNIESRYIKLYNESSGYSYVRDWKIGNRLASEIKDDINKKALLLGAPFNSFISDGMLWIYYSKALPDKIPDYINAIGRNNWVQGDIKLANRHIKLGKMTFIIDDRTFKESELETIEFNDSLAYIGSDAFQLCKNLRRIEIPNSVKFIGNAVFAWCDKLEYIRLPKNAEYLGNIGALFMGCPKLYNFSFYSVKHIYLDNDAIIRIPGVRHAITIEIRSSNIEDLIARSSHLIDKEKSNRKQSIAKFGRLILNSKVKGSIDEGTLGDLLGIQPMKIEYKEMGDE